jgi:hypothetical protein
MVESTQTSEPQTALCMLSGGLDSLGAVYLALTDRRFANYRVHVHHLVVRNVENRATAEQVACANICNHLRSAGYRQFEYTESEHEYQFMRQYYIWDVTLVGLIAGGMIRDDPSIAMLVGGRVKDDLSSDPADLYRMNLGHRVFHTMLPIEMRYQRPWMHPLTHMTHEEVYRMLPADLRDLAWSCRTPRYHANGIDECGSCKACIRMKQIRLANP